MNFDRMTEFLDYLTTILAPGVDCIVQKEGKTIYRHMAGWADREKQIPMKGDELFYLYSSSKVITCTAALQLLEAGKYLLNDPVADYLPEFGDMKVNRRLNNKNFEIVPARNQITVGDLFAMTAGLDYILDTPEILEVRRNNPDASTREIVRAIAASPLLYEPGTCWHYSLAHDVLGALIEVWSGESFGEYVKHHITEPLGMKNTGFACSDDIKARMMQQYVRDEFTGEISVMGLTNEYIFSAAYESGGAGLISCVDDYIKFASAMANGGAGESGQHILSPGTIELMHTNRLTDPELAAFHDWPKFLGYGYGLGVRTLMDRAAAGSNGPVGEFGWDGAAGSSVLIDPVNHIAAFYTQHVRTPNGDYTHPRLRNLLYGALD